jgi:hypothetical protein
MQLVCGIGGQSLSWLGCTNSHCCQLLIHLVPVAMYHSRNSHRCWMRIHRMINNTSLTFVKNTRPILLKKSQELFKSKAGRIGVPLFSWNNHPWTLGCHASRCYILMPHDLARLRLFPAQKPTNWPTPPSVPPTFCTSSSLRSTNSSVAAKALEVSVVMKSSELAYTAPKEALFVYQEVSTLVSPARYQISSERAWSSLSDAGILPTRDMWPSACRTAC